MASHCNAQNVEIGNMEDALQQRRVSTSLALSFVCSRCRSKEGIVVETLWDGIEKVMGFCHLGDWLNVSGGSNQQ